MKVVKLSMHKNNKKQREAKEFRKNAIRNFKNAVNIHDTIGYAFLSWNENGDMSTSYSVPEESPFPTQTLPEVVKFAFIERLTRD